MPIEHCTLDVLGPLLDLGDVPDQRLIDQALETASVLVDFAVAKAMANGADATIEEARTITREMLAADVEHIQEVKGPPRLIRLFAQAADHLVLLLIMNGLRSQVVERLQAAGFPPRHDPQALRRIAVELDGALEARDAEQIADIMKELLTLIRESVKRKFDDFEGEQQVALT